MIRGAEHANPIAVEDRIRFGFDAGGAGWRGVATGGEAHEDLRRAIVAGVPDLLDELDSDTRNVLLTLARIWMTLDTGEITSKDIAADWAIARLPEAERRVLAHARAIYLGDEAEDWADLGPLIRPVADRLVAEIERSAG